MECYKYDCETDEEAQAVFKATRAYKIGFTDGCNGEYDDYERGYKEHAPALTCYQCDKAVEWLTPDSRCGDCTRMTVEEVSGC